MAFALRDFASTDNRREDREEVHYRARAADQAGQPLQLLVVNLSPHGLMARCDREFATGDRVRITLPGIGAIIVEIRWCLGGRFGGQFDRPIDRAHYYELVALLVRNG